MYTRMGYPNWDSLGDNNPVSHTVANRVTLAQRSLEWVPMISLIGGIRFHPGYMYTPIGVVWEISIRSALRVSVLF